MPKLPLHVSISFSHTAIFSTTQTMVSCSISILVHFTNTSVGVFELQRSWQTLPITTVPFLWWKLRKSTFSLQHLTDMV